MKRVHPRKNIHGEPVVSPWMLRFFRAYSRRYMQRHFHALRIAKIQAPPQLDPAQPVIVYLNHSSWWDPLVCLILAEHCFPKRDVFAPMDAAQLRRYRFFKKLGMFGVDSGTRHGAVEFFCIASRVLTWPNAMLWLTPQARFTDTRERPLRFAPGLARLVQMHPHALLQPLAIEYTFWNERLPEALTCFGPAEYAADVADFGNEELITRHLESRLAQTMEVLAESAARRDPEAFHSLLNGRGGVAWSYDAWRRLKAVFRGEPFHPDHGVIAG